jgi:hypothetical protein
MDPAKIILFLIPVWFLPFLRGYLLYGLNKYLTKTSPDNKFSVFLPWNFIKGNFSHSRFNYDESDMEGGPTDSPAVFKMHHPVPPAV